MVSGNELYLTLVVEVRRLLSKARDRHNLFMFSMHVIGIGIGIFNVSIEVLMEIKQQQTMTNYTTKA